MSKFQIATLAVFFLALIGGIIAFATYKNNTATSTLPHITIWGTFPQDIFNQHVAEINNSQKQSLSVTYVQKNPDSFGQEFVQALARGMGPDAILLPSDMLLPHLDKILSIPYEWFSQRDFMNAYIPQARMYLGNEGILATPFTVDPLVMYWNMDIYNTSGFASHPKYWSDFDVVVPKITSKDKNGNIRKSAVAMGTFNNIANARELLGTLMMQVGNPVTARNSEGQVQSTLRTNVSFDPQYAVEYFSHFANPTDPEYSWNRGLVDDKTSFLSGSLATYFGFASEIQDIRAKNPNLNFDVAPLPQAKSGGKISGYGKMYGFSIVRSSPTPGAAYEATNIIAGTTALGTLKSKLYIPSVMVAHIGSVNDPYMANFEKAVLVSSSWLDIDIVQSRRIFGNMIDDITSGRKRVKEAVDDAGAEYQMAIERSME